MCKLVQKNTCVTCTPAHALVPKTPVTKCTQHSLQKNAHMYIYTHTCTRTHMHTNTHVHLWHRPTRRDTDTETHNLCTNIHTHTYTHVYTAYKYIYTGRCIHIHTCMSVHIHTYTHIRTHIQHVHKHTRKHAWNESAEATARGADVDAGGSPRLFRPTQSTAFRTSNARTSLYPLPETPIPLNLPSPLRNIPQNSSQPFESAILLFHTDQHNRVHNSEETPRSFTMAVCVVVDLERLKGKQRCSRAPVGEHTGARARDYTMWLFTRNERSAKNKPNPAAAHHTITTARRPDHTHSSALVQGQSTWSIAD